MKKEFLSKIYDILYKRAHTLIQEANPCAIKNGICADGTFCCGGCKHLINNKCSVEALWCKVWFCHSAKVNLKPEYKAKFEGLHNIAGRYNLLRYRASKEETLELAEKFPRQEWNF